MYDPISEGIIIFTLASGGSAKNRKSVRQFK